MALSTEQLLLLNNIMYMGGDNSLPSLTDFCDSKSGDSKTIGDYIDYIKNNIADHPITVNDGSRMTSDDWQNIISAVEKDKTLQGYTIQTTHTDYAEGGGGGYSALFVNKNSGDAVVTFAGTASGEWKDDFVGGNVLETPQQRNALEWYQEIYKENGLENYEVTVTGHSKGGNKSKFITVMDNTVDHCVSFDGQGFSDKFMDEYADKIAARQGKIHNHNVDSDYVNFLLNDIGEKTYYKGFDKGDFFENHCANTFMKFDGNGNFVMEVNPDGQSPIIKTLDEFVNSYLRSLSDEDRSRALNLLGTIAEDLLSGGDVSVREILDLALYEGNDDFTHLLAYALRFAQDKGMDMLCDALSSIGLGALADITKSAYGLMNHSIELFGFKITLMDIIGLLNNQAGWLSKILDFIGLDDLILKFIDGFIPFDIKLSDIKRLLRMIGSACGQVSSIKIEQDMGDRKVRTGSSRFSPWGFLEFQISIDANAVRGVIDELNRIANALASKAGELEDVCDGLDSIASTSFLMKRSLNGSCIQIETLENKMKGMSNVLVEMLDKFEVIDEKIIVNMNETVK